MDFNYPHHLHDSHDDYPLAPESLEIGRDMYSSAQRAVFPDTAPQRKLIPNLRDKVKYVVDYRNLKLYLQLGLVVTKVHRVLTFKHSPWLKTYIDFNTGQRSFAGNSFLKDFFKLMNNSVYGKTQENWRKRVQVELIADVCILRKRVVKPGFCKGNPITDCLTVVQCKVATESSHLCGLFRARAVKVAHVRLPLQSYVCKVPRSWSAATTVHGYG